MADVKMSPYDLIYNIGLLTDMINEMQAKFNSGEYRTLDKASELQKHKNRRNELRGQLEPLRLVWSHPFPDTLPEPERRSRNEIRAFLGLPPVADEEV